MKKLLMMVLATVAVSSCSSPKQNAEAQLLIERLDTLRSKGIMFGHQDDPMYGLTWAYVATILL